jgi:hypothetical protein
MCKNLIVNDDLMGLREWQELAPDHTFDPLTEDEVVVYRLSGWDEYNAPDAQAFLAGRPERDI